MTKINTIECRNNILTNQNTHLKTVLQNYRNGEISSTPMNFNNTDPTTPKWIHPRNKLPLQSKKKLVLPYYDIQTTINEYDSSPTYDPE